MAEGTSTGPVDTECSSADQDTSTGLPPNSSNTMCRFFLKGKCLFGDNCWNSHASDASPAQSDLCERHARQVSASQDGPAPMKEPTWKDKYKPKFSSLSKKTPKNESYTSGQNPPNWVDAPVFVPRTIMSYADTLKSNCVPEVSYIQDPVPTELCPFFMDGECPFGQECPYIHGDQCDICQKACMNPYDEQQRQQHTELCEKELEKDMELSFAVQRSRDKSCGICMEVIMEKEPLSERRFGILEKCNHIFCLACIRKWRKVKRFEPSAQIDGGLDPVVTRACPECRAASDFITPSQFWVDTEEEKVKLISDYKVALGKKSCKYFKQGKGTCPFGGSCFYLHAKPDGTKVDLPPPVRRRRRNQDGEVDFFDQISLWDFVELREDSNLLLQLELNDLLYSVSESGSDTEEASD